MLITNLVLQRKPNKIYYEYFLVKYWGALHKIGRFRNVPTVGTFVNKFNFNFINKRTYGRYVSETTYFM